MVRPSGEPGQRITDIARPGTVLADAPTKEAAGEEAYRYSFAGKRRIKGLDGEVELHRVRRDEPGDET